MLTGISSYTYGWNIGVEKAIPANAMNELDLVDYTIDFGLQCLQIGDNLPVHTFNESRKADLKQLLIKNQIRLELGARRLTAAHLQTYIELCRFFNAPLLRFVIDGDDYKPDLIEVSAIIKDFLPELKKYNITLGIENHDRFKAKQLADMMEAIGDDQVGICLDCVNSIGAGEGLGHVTGILASYTVNLHIKDFTISRLAHKMGFFVMGEIAGTGMTDLPLLLEKLEKYGRCQSAILEQWVPPEMNIEDTCRKEKHWAALGVAYVKSVLLKQKQSL
ncbi:sugar phosphate isomerase/epimerase family protein [Dyadobacter arcticus]|uniref:Sugar phosphate isomerase/epimerase n=1 Tax=Dyadobacter arcticus TaxID=1078754 RepID=A0ABX0UPG7_9BACT|nr:TIM barrel protein [Dyadobacter arcticus]NIJ53859.1 sugar phosphate isomerase/epimerase [Dyadobacter arcticus]